MFRIDWMERRFSRTRPWQVVAIWGPVMLWLLWRGFADATLTAGTAVGLLALGVLAWTLLEYLLHRWVFHFQPGRDSELQRDLAFLIHGVHHDYPYDADRLVMPPLVAAALAVVIGGPLRILVGPHLFAPIFAGLVGGYFWYDLTHYAVHHLRPRTALGAFQRRRHMRHHFKDSRSGFGVTTPLWDLVFRTAPSGARAVREGALAAETVERGPVEPVC